MMFLPLNKHLLYLSSNVFILLHTGLLFKLVNCFYSFENDCQHWIVIILSILAFSIDITFIILQIKVIAIYSCSIF